MICERCSIREVLQDGTVCDYCKEHFMINDKKLRLVKYYKIEQARLEADLQKYEKLVKYIRNNLTYTNRIIKDLEK